jgi:hypothetical protein
MARMEGRQSSPRRIEISLTQLIAGSAAAACGAWLASKIGVAGTVIGAAIVSAFVTLLSAIYAQGVRRARERLVIRRELLRTRPRLPASYAEDAPLPNEDAPLPKDDGEAELDDLEATRTLLLPAVQLEDTGGYRWGRIALAAVAVFVVAMLVVTVIELLDGRSFSCSTSGRNCGNGTTLIPGITHPKATPSTSTSSQAPTTSGAPTPTVTETFTATPSVSGTPTPTVTFSATPSSSSTTSTSPAGPAG